MADRLKQGDDLFRVELDKVGAANNGWQVDRAVADSLEAVDFYTLGFPQTPHFTGAPFGKNDPEPAVASALCNTPGMLGFNRLEFSQAIFQNHPVSQALDHGLVTSPGHAPYTPA